MLKFNLIFLLSIFFYSNLKSVPQNIFQAIQTCNIEEVKKFQDQINTVRLGGTPLEEVILRIAKKECPYGFIDEIINLGVNVHYKNRQGRNYLHYVLKRLQDSIAFDELLYVFKRLSQEGVAPEIEDLKESFVPIYFGTQYLETLLKYGVMIPDDFDVDEHLSYLADNILRDLAPFIQKTKEAKSLQRQLNNLIEGSIEFEDEQVHEIKDLINLESLNSWQFWNILNIAFDKLQVLNDDDYSRARRVILTFANRFARELILYFKTKTFEIETGTNFIIPQDLLLPIFFQDFIDKHPELKRFLNKEVKLKSGKIFNFVDLILQELEKYRN